MPGEREIRSLKECTRALAGAYKKKMNYGEWWPAFKRVEQLYPKLPVATVLQELVGSLTTKVPPEPAKAIALIPSQSDGERKRTELAIRVLDSFPYHMNDEDLRRRMTGRSLAELLPIIRRFTSPSFQALLQKAEIDFEATPRATRKAFDEFVAYTAFSDLKAGQNIWWTRFGVSAREFARFASSIGNTEFISKLEPIFPYLDPPDFAALRARRADPAARKRRDRAIKRIRAKQKFLKN